MTSLEIETDRLRLRTWTEGDRDDLAQMLADPEVMHDYGGPVSQAQSHAKLDSYAGSFSSDGYSRWLVETAAGTEPRFVGYVGVLAQKDSNHPLGCHSDIGWRLTRAAWGNGYATEAAQAALDDVFDRVGLTEVLSYTAADNRRSQAVMNRLGLTRDPSRDFTVDYPVIGAWNGLVWVAHSRDGQLSAQPTTLETMSLSTSLLVLAVLAALVPVALVGTSPPRTIRDAEKSLVSSFLVIVMGALIVNGFHDLSFFGLVHLLYLLVVVTLPVALGAWFLLSLRSGRQRLDTAYGVLAAGLLLLGLYGTHVEPRWLRVDEVTVTAAVPASLTIGVIADLQTPTVGAHERNAIAQVLERNPDIVVVPGDWYQGPVEQLEAERPQFVELLRELVAGSQLVAVTSGDSDHGMSLESIVTEAGALFIDDTVLAFTVNGIDVRLAGVRVLANGPQRATTLASLNDQTNALSILVAHRPDVVYELSPTADVDLLIAGHTHGGQVQVPFFGPPVTFSEIPRDLASGGLGVINNVPIYVSAGVGLERLQAPQVRIGARPEVGIITVQPG